MRDLDRVREKIEVRLEPRQVVVLAVVTAVFCGGLFAGGYLLGLSHGPGSSTDPALGRLAAIDAFAGPRAEAPASAAPATEALGEVEFMFPSALGARPARQRPAARPVKLPQAVVAEHVDSPVEAAPDPVEDAPTEAPARPRPMVIEPARIAAAAPRPEPRPEPRAASRVAPIAPRPASRREVEPELPPAALAALDEDAPRAVAPAAPRPAVPAPDDLEGDEDAPPRRGSTQVGGDSRFTLQLKAARERDEAASYAADVRRAGYEPHIVLAEVPGRGRFYRVRVGEFPSRAAARSFQRRFRQESGLADAGFVTEL
ncbi:MAG: SPOR domain-containing protein [bacterium]